MLKTYCKHCNGQNNAQCNSTWLWLDSLQLQTTKLNCHAMSDCSECSAVLSTTHGWLCSMSDVCTQHKTVLASNTKLSPHPAQSKQLYSNPTHVPVNIGCGKTSSACAPWTAAFHHRRASTGESAPTGEARPSQKAAQSYRSPE
jgi:hypothetical protein